MNSNIFAIVSFFLFGLWGFFSKLSVLHINAKDAFVYQVIGVMLSIIPVLVLNPNIPIFIKSPKGVLCGILTGLSYGLGCFFFLLAVTKGKIAPVVTFTALYPVITILLSIIILREPSSIKQVVGFVFALIAMYFLAS